MLLIFDFSYNDVHRSLFSDSEMPTWHADVNCNDSDRTGAIDDCEGCTYTKTRHLCVFLFLENFACLALAIA